MTRALREIAAPFVAAAPAGVRVRTRLRVTAGDEAVLRAAGRHLGSLAGRDLAARYRLSCPVAFSYRGDETAAQAATGAVRYDIALDPASGRWYLDASWRTPARPAPSLGELRQAPALAVDLNAGHPAAAVIAPDGNGACR